MGRQLALIIYLLIFNILGFSQTPTQDSIADTQALIPHPKPIDSTFVTYNSIQFDSVFLNSSTVIDTLTFHASNINALEAKTNIYSTLSNSGLAHKSLRFNHINRIGFDMTLPAYAALMQDENNMVSYQSVLPYSELRYLMTVGNQEQHLNARFGRQFAKGLFVSFAFNTDYAPATFINNKTINNYFWVNVHYLTDSKRYGVGAYWYRNKMEMQENGGIVNDEDYSSHTESDNSVINTNLNSASNYIVSSGAGLEHYFNLLPQTTHDTVMRKFTLGRISHSYSYRNNKLYYNESSPSATFYHPFDTLLNTSKSTDTTLIRAFKNTLKWSSLGYQKYNGDIPFYLYAGVTHGFYRVKHFDYLEGETLLSRNYQQLSVNGGIIINLFKSTRITGYGELITLGYQIGDFDIKGQWKQFIGTTSKNFGQASFDIELKRQSANWFEEKYYSNHFRWENNFKASTYLTFNLNYRYKSYTIGVKQTSIANFIYFNTDARPAQNESMFSIREAYLSFYQKIGRFELEGFASLQKSSNEAVVHLPLAMGQLKFGYSQPIFHKAATLHPSLTVRYFTKYYADAYMPATRSFYLQNEVQIGNYPFIDLAVTIKVKKAHIYVAYSNMFLLTGNYNAFIAPHYPARDSQIFIGVNWRLFN